jgi:uncharacterized protein YjbI with pentapeptide repeats
MTAEHPPNISDPDEQIAKPVRTIEALFQLYETGHRNFSGSDLRGTTVEVIDSKIKVIDFKEIILRGSNLKAIKFRHSYDPKVDLAGADLSECDLQGADLSSCRLDRCNFTNSDLRGADFSGASCRGSDFIQARISIFGNGNSDFTASDFHDTDFRSASISGKFHYSNFCGANLQKATLNSFYADNANFSGANLKDVNFPKPALVSFNYAYYNHQTKLSDDFDPIGRKMELIEDSIPVNS